MTQFGGFAWMIAAFVVALSVIVAIHEYGHYIVGRWSGIHADVFSVGFGPVIWSGVDKRGTKWQIAALPFGGYVKFAGDANAASGKDEEAMAEVEADPVALRRTMHGAPLWARAATVAAGPVFNFVLSIIIFGAVLMNSGAPRDPLTIGTLPSLPADAITLQDGDVVLKIAGLDAPAPSTASLFTFANDLPRTSLLPYEVERAGAVMIVDGPFPTLARVGGVTPQSAAIAAGLKEGDVIVGVNGDPIVAFAELKTAVESSDGASVALSVWRDGETFDTELTPKRVDEPQPEGGFVTSWRIGIISSYAFDPATESIGVGTAISAGASQVWRIIEGSVSGLKHMIVGDISTCNLSGPIGIAQTSGAMASQGIDSFIWFIAVLSTAVGFLNLFPIPALDGGHLVFYAYEAVTGKPPNDGWLRVLMTFGLIMVLSLMVFALGNDIFCP